MIKITVIGLIICVFGIFLKQVRLEYALVLSLVGCVFIFAGICESLSEIITELLALLEGLGIQSSYLNIIIKMLLTAYLAEFSCSVCKDAGFMALASQIEIFAKLYILTISMPVVMALLDTVNGLWS